MATPTALAPSSDEYGHIKYLLQLSLQRTTIKGLNIWSVANPHLNVQFMRVSEGQPVLESWVNATDIAPGASLGGRDAVEVVCNEGFALPGDGSGRIFSTGNIVPRGGRLAPGAYRFLLCHIAVGRAFVVEDASTETRDKLPAGYDSLYIIDALDADGDKKVSEEEYRAAATHGGRSPDEYRHSYVLFDERRVLPKYVVEFTLYESSAKPRGVDAYMGELQERLFQLKGPARDDDEDQEWDMVSGAATHALEDILEKYKNALAEASTEDPLFVSQSTKLRESLSTVEEKMKKVQQNSAAVEEAIYERLQELLFQLQDHTQKKLAVLLAEELEMRRQLERIQWSASFASKLQDTLPPVKFVEAWQKHTSHRAALHAEVEGGISRASLGAIADVQADLHLVGTMEVVSGVPGAGAAGRTTVAAISGSG
eukprot:CAMPEP_0203818522 /NCGR_PEP_ID=MMETSP0115-20131106/31881_1 /ASSEMBLY_ACC=CAM_ASM_000227 /TAXON_ID=33651 /ORGANISM="Bicosoecid sp, Strain ms1" /LENGTH=425 /DNA_ID=CAMNT_0050727489 /DNA_START=114 /DNA_END=1388 /DNA_ORIENTATION=+